MVFLRISWAPFEMRCIFGFCGWLASNINRLRILSRTCWWNSFEAPFCRWFWLSCGYASCHLESGFPGQNIRQRVGDEKTAPREPGIMIVTKYWYNNHAMITVFYLCIYRISYLSPLSAAKLKARVQYSVLQIFLPRNAKKKELYPREDRKLP